MQYLYAFQTRIGPFYVARLDDRYHPVYQEESLGSYSSPEQAVDDLAGGFTFAIQGGVDTGRLGIPDDLAKWKKRH